MSDRLAEILGNNLVRAIDLVFDLLTEFGVSVAGADIERVRPLSHQLKEALSTWLALLVERLDSRNAQQLVDMHRRIKELEAKIGDGTSLT